jgi:hypothetical protein
MFTAVHRLRELLPTRLKTLSPLFNRIEQCFAAHVVHTCHNIVEPESGVTILFNVVGNYMNNNVGSKTLFNPVFINIATT